MIFVLAIAVVFLGTALVVVLAMASHERDRWAQERGLLLTRITHPNVISPSSVPPTQQLPAMVPEDWGELNKVGSIIPIEDGKKE